VVVVVRTVGRDVGPAGGRHHQALFAVVSGASRDWIAFVATRGARSRPTSASVLLAVGTVAVMLVMFVAVVAVGPGR
jgi:hypothetical protein